MLNSAHTRSMVRAALGGRLDGIPTTTDPIFGLEVPASCPDVPALFLQPRSTWADPEAYDRQARKLARMFAENFVRFADGVPPAVREAGPESPWRGRGTAPIS